MYKPILLFFTVLFLNCNSNKSDINLKGILHITNKKVLIGTPLINSSSRFKFKNNEYPLENDVYYNKEGKILKLGVSKAEGMLFYFKNPKKLQLPLEKRHLKSKITIDTINNWIIDNNDTIKNLKQDHKTKILFSKNIKTGRIIIYSYI